jgi:hypothetical protein
VRLGLSLREGHKLRVFENRVLRKTFGHQWDEVRGEWRRQCDRQLYDLNCPPFIIRGIN